MSYWVEIHCDGMSKNGKNDLARYNDADCHSYSSADIGAMVNRLPGAMQALQIRAREAKWKRRGGKWLCPYCAPRLISAGKQT
jgi:hypothetical protein